MPRFPLTTLLIFVTCALATATAQNVRWQLAEGYLAKGQNSNLVLIFENCVPQGDITLPPLPNLRMDAPQTGRQESSTFINGRASTQVITYYAYPTRPLVDTPVEIPRFTVETDQGPMTVEAVRYDVREATIGDTAIPVSQVAQSALTIGDGSIWAGEVVPVSYTLDVSARFRANIGNDPEWTPAPLVVETWNEPTRATRGSGGAARNVLSYSTRGYINTPGSHVIPSVQQLVNIGIPTAGIFQSLRAEQYAITSDSPVIEVQPLPTPAPPGFNGAVGDFKLVSTVVPEQAAVGEPVTWTLSVEGEGNWPDIPGLPVRQVSQSFRVVQPDARREMVEGKLFQGSISEDVVLIPTQAGEFTFGPVNWVYFDPQTGTYQTLSSPATVLQVSPAAAPSNPRSLGANGPMASVPDSSPAINATPAPDAPSTLPLEVLSGSGSSWSPWPRRDVVTAAAVIVACFPLLWLALSFSRARRVDPGKPARKARQQLSGIVQHIERASGPEREKALAAWRQHSAILWQSHHAAPSPDLFANDEAWTRLWIESDRALYAEHAELPEDWTARARAALASKPAPRFPLFSVFAPRNLLPLLCIACIAGLPFETQAQADTDYRNGKFAEAEETWRASVSAHPDDWIAHHNLALALAQQNQWSEAGAHAVVAFVQNPRHPSTRWHLAYTLERSGYTPPVIGRFITPGWPERLAQFASPAEWQRALLAGIALAMISLSLILLHAYGWRVPAWKFLSWTGGLTAVIVMASAGFSLQVWSTVGHADAALTWQAGELRSIPTDLNAEQQTAPLAAGSLCRIERSFLGWRQLSFPNGQTGWVRKEALVPLWDRAP